MHVLCWGLLWAVSVAEAQAQPLARAVNLLSKSPAARNATWAIAVSDPVSRKVIYERGSTHTLMPASTAKLFTTGMALTRLGPDFRFATRVLAGGPIHDGVLEGDLLLVGGGDPNLSSRKFPYRAEEPFDEDRLAPMEKLADQIAAAGVRRVRGDLIGDDTLFARQPVPPGWSAGDMAWSYGAPVSALVFNDSSIRVRVEPALEPGAPARISIDPGVEYLTVRNQVVTSADGVRKVTFLRSPASDELLLSGTLPVGAKKYELDVAPSDSALFAAAALREALLRCGIAVDGRTRARHREPGEAFVAAAGREIAARMSPPLIDAIRVTNKDSENLHAEMLLLGVAAQTSGPAGRDRAVELLNEFVNGLDAPRDSFQFEDGSGLSRLTLVSPAALVRLLEFMYRSNARAEWLSTLPHAGVDGTLKDRFGKKGVPVFAKTGTLTHVSALAGYALPPGRPPRAFALLVNHSTAPASAIRPFIDKIVLTLVH